MDPNQLKQIIDVMTQGKVFRLVSGDIQIEMSQYAYAPKLPAIPEFTPPPKQDDINNYPPEMRASFQAFNDPMEAIGKALGGVPQRDEPLGISQDPTDPDAPINDSELFGVGMPQPN
jgi:hypothetical protein